MTFKIEKKFGFNYLIHNSSLKDYGIFFGHLDLDHLNNIYKKLYEATHDFDFKELEENLRSNLSKVLDSKEISNDDQYFINECLTILDNSPMKELSLYKYYLAQIANASLCSYCLNILEYDLPRIWFKDFIPSMTVTQLNNNPYSDEHPMFDPKVEWKVSVNGFIYRRWFQLFNRFTFEYKLI